MTIEAFGWPNDVKKGMAKSVSSHFLGFTGRGSEVTNDLVDNREIFDFATEEVLESYGGLKSVEDDYMALVGRNCWPDPEVTGDEFRNTTEQYMLHMRLMYRKVLEHLEVALELPTGALQALDSAEAQHRLKLVKYFPVDGISTSTGQGVGAHQDETGWLTFVSEVDAAGLQIHTRNGKSWIEIPIGSNSWALNIGKAFERATSGCIHATLHRVQSPAQDTPPRHSIVFFAGLPLNQSYSSLQGIFGQSAPLSRLEASEHALSSVEYLKELGRLRVSEDSGDTFGSSQLKMWKRSYKI